MISRLTKKEFIKKLKENCVDGDPYQLGSPLAVFSLPTLMKRKKFCGKISNSGFQITSNSLLKLTPYLIKGELKQGKGLEIDYKVRPIWFGYIFVRIIPILVLVLIGLLLLTQDNNIPIDAKIAILIFGMFMFGPVIVTMKYKNKMVKEFRRILEVEESNLK